MQVCSRFRAGSQQVQSRFRAGSEQVQRRFRAGSEQVSEYVQSMFRVGSEYFQSTFGECFMSSSSVSSVSVFGIFLNIIQDIASLIKKCHNLHIVLGFRKHHPETE